MFNTISKFVLILQKKRDKVLFEDNVAVVGVLDERTQIHTGILCPWPGLSMRLWEWGHTCSGWQG